MNRITIKVNIKNSEEKVEIILYQKIYSTPEGVVNHWLSGTNSLYRLEILSTSDYEIQPEKVNKDLQISTTEVEIADQVMKKLYEQRIVQLQIY